MNTKILGLCSVIHHVTDLETAKRWYADAFGVKPYFDQPFYVGFQFGGFELGLDPDPKQYNSPGFGSITYWRTDNVQAMFDHLIRSGAQANEHPNCVGGDLIIASVRDPFGNVIGLMYNPEFKITE
ncbi:VOC family protein [bacterium]|nr:VOC family protein [bacterium]